MRSTQYLFLRIWHTSFHQLPQRDGKQTPVQFHGFLPVVGQHGSDARRRPLQKCPQTRQIALAPSGGRFHFEGENPAARLNHEVHFVTPLLVPVAHLRLGQMSFQQGGEILRHIGLKQRAAQQIVASAQQQAAGMDQIAAAMSNINQASSQHLAATQQAMEAAGLPRWLIERLSYGR